MIRAQSGRMASKKRTWCWKSAGGWASCCKLASAPTWFTPAATTLSFPLRRGLASNNPRLRKRGVTKAPFVVVIGANMPSILAEISFVSNPGDEKRLRTAEYRQRIAESLYRGIAKYVSGLSGVKVASRIDKAQGQ